MDNQKLRLEFAKHHVKMMYDPISKISVDERWFEDYGEEAPEGAPAMWPMILEKNPYSVTDFVYNVGGKIMAPRMDALGHIARVFMAHGYAIRVADKVYAGSPMGLPLGFEDYFVIPKGRT